MNENEKNFEEKEITEESTLLDPNEQEQAKPHNDEVAELSDDISPAEEPQEAEDIPSPGEAEPIEPALPIEQDAEVALTEKSEDTEVVSAEEEPAEVIDTPVYHWNYETEKKYTAEKNNVFDLHALGKNERAVRFYLDRGKILADRDGRYAKISYLVSAFGITRGEPIAHPIGVQAAVRREEKAEPRPRIRKAFPNNGIIAVDIHGIVIGIADLAAADDAFAGAVGEEKAVCRGGIKFLSSLLDGERKPLHRHALAGICHDAHAAVSIDGDIFQAKIFAVLKEEGGVFAVVIVREADRVSHGKIGAHASLAVCKQ